MEAAPPAIRIHLEKSLPVSSSLGLTARALDEELRLYAPAATKTPIIELAAEFEGASGHKTLLVFDTAGAAEQRFLADDSATFLITTQKRITDAEKTGKLKDGVTDVVGDTVGGFAAPPGETKPDISTPENLKAVLLALPRIAFSDPAPPPSPDSL